MRKSISHAGVGLAVVGAVAAAGCGKVVLKHDKSEAFVRDHVTGAQSVSCPNDVEAKAGKTFDCQVTAADGSKETVTVHMVSVSGTTVNLELGPSDVHKEGGASTDTTGGASTGTTGTGTTGTDTTGGGSTGTGTTGTDTSGASGGGGY
jgi:hypothetical protein